NILGGGSTSRLFYRIREQEGLAYNIFSFHDLFRQAGTFGVYAGVAPENFRDVVHIILNEIKKLHDTPITEAELDLYRQELKGELLMAHEHAETHMTRIGKSIIYHNRILSIKEILSALDMITPLQICQFFRKYCTFNNIALVSLGPAKYKLSVKDIRRELL
ncbi:MAG: M16 family metallopeptidase, partial [Candidatus Hydrogenedens sp.]